MPGVYTFQDREWVTLEEYKDLELAYKTLKSYLRKAEDVERVLTLKIAKLEEQRNYWIDTESFNPEAEKKEMNLELEKIV
jgi:hypothetical protein